jgi:Carboxypeptidase regulatory-like domain
VAGTPSTTAPSVRPGNASLNGTVFGPQGPVRGATVLAERFVGGAIASVEARTASDGSWTISDVQGGQYRVRAWSAPSLSDTTPQYVYLSDDQVLSISIEVSQFTGPVVASSLAPSSPLVGDPVNLAVQVTSPEVGGDGVVRNPPLEGTPVVVEDDPGWTVTGSATETTGVSGVVVFRLTCDFAGDNPLSVAVGSQPPDALQLPICTSPPPSSTTTTTTTIAPIPTTTPTSSEPTLPTTTTTGVPG